MTNSQMIGMRVRRMWNKIKYWFGEDAGQNVINVIVVISGSLALFVVFGGILEWLIALLT